MVPTGSSLGLGDTIQDTGVLYGIDTERYTYCMVPTLLNRDGTLKHSYHDDKWVLVPLGHCNWKWKQARGNYSTYEQELLAGMLVLSSPSR